MDSQVELIYQTVKQDITFQEISSTDPFGFDNDEFKGGIPILEPVKCEPYDPDIKIMESGGDQMATLQPVNCFDYEGAGEIVENTDIIQNTSALTNVSQEALTIVPLSTSSFEFGGETWQVVSQPQVLTQIQQVSLPQLHQVHQVHQVTLPNLQQVILAQPSPTITTLKSNFIDSYITADSTMSSDHMEGELSNQAYPVEVKQEFVSNGGEATQGLGQVQYQLQETTLLSNNNENNFSEDSTSLQNQVYETLGNLGMFDGLALRYEVISNGSATISPLTVTTTSTATSTTPTPNITPAPTPTPAPKTPKQKAPPKEKIDPLGPMIREEQEETGPAWYCRLCSYQTRDRRYIRKHVTRVHCKKDGAGHPKPKASPPASPITTPNTNPSVIQQSPTSIQPQTVAVVQQQPQQQTCIVQQQPPQPTCIVQQPTCIVQQPTCIVQQQPPQPTCIVQQQPVESSDIIKPPVDQINNTNRPQQIQLNVSSSSVSTTRSDDTNSNFSNVQIKREVIEDVPKQTMDQSIQSQIQLDIKPNINLKPVIIKQLAKLSTVPKPKPPPPQHICDICGWKAKARYLLQNHFISKHQDGRPFPCELCSYKAKFKSSYLRHVQTIHEGLRPFSCQYCSYKATQKSCLERHVRAQHSQTKPFGCSFCPFRAMTKSEVEKHVDEKHDGRRPFTCYTCGFTTLLKRHLRHHMLRKHDGRRPYACSYKNCTYRTSKKSSLDNHVKYKHVALRPFGCHHCPYTATSKGNLRAHIVSIHLRDRQPKKRRGVKRDLVAGRPVLCECGLLTASRIAYAKHRGEVHGEEVLACSVCPYLTTVASNLHKHTANKHLRSHGLLQGFRACAYCQFNSHSKRALRLHIKTVHKIM